MNVPIISRPLPVEAANRKALHDLFVSLGYSLLKEVVAASCVEHQVEYANRMLYASNPDALAIAARHLERAKVLAQTLEVLDDLQLHEEKWVKVELEPRR